MSFDTTIFEIGKNRIEALSDGIFAIVMTLLILEFHAPDLDQRPERLSTGFHCAVLFRGQPRHDRLDSVLSMDLCKLTAGHAGSLCQRRIPHDGKIPHADSSDGNNTDC